MNESKTAKTALVTGGAVGIGKGVALAFASRGYDIAISHFGEEDQANAVAARIRNEFGRTCFVRPCDLTEAAAPSALVGEAVRELGRLDVLVNNAGVSRFSDVRKLTPGEFDRLVHLNLRAPLLAMQAAAAHMVERGIRGSIVNITSTRAERAHPGDAVYGATKAGLTRASQSAALDLAPYGIRVNCVAPGATASREGEDVRRWYEAIGRKIPLGRTGTTADIGEACAWLASEQAAYVTGTTLRVDGGLIVPGMPEDVSPEAGYGWGRPFAD
ncbi:MULTISPECIES: SDR family NAD(P)-dependent oxidoreductase [Cohnella]|uniref:SDR family NAD(P)-dependent oxidoreductase n=1 Tax=Cohnella TaxID=329857 RepID=UPI0009BB1999|nr:MULTISPECIES: SDR family NAD(P)-dependent oxidoreductase [Cohnella]MBN2984055.1 SDR family oxidoreductase [Cohnella algarum]